MAENYSLNSNTSAVRWPLQYSCSAKHLKGKCDKETGPKVGTACKSNFGASLVTRLHSRALPEALSALSS
ncbi:hypothetical protein SAMN05216190_12944 [Pseudomonas borbori]|uniref:Uncharacterized protein n=1 Tax=Pseudomonas borbori TaxID=289003 RepID=A0A1I5V7Z2_9PSED|nr:hypothetical protein SAMN05216190_12944 [Pseudomonas borbori]